MTRSLLLILILAGTTTSPVVAHTLVADGVIGVTMHVDPDDAPVTGKPSRFYFWFNDTTGHFDPSQCEGTFAVFDRGQGIATQPLFSAEATGFVSVHDVLFSKPGVYTVRVTGIPRVAKLFQPFHVEFTIRVSPGEGAVASGSSEGWLGDHWLILVLGFLVAGAVVAWGLTWSPSPQKKE